MARTDWANGEDVDAAALNAIGSGINSAATAATTALSRANHTGTQLANTISNFTTAVQAAAAPLLAGSNVSLVVAAPNASAATKTGADYVCDGTQSTGGDEVEINAAIAALPAAGGKIVLSGGQFWRTAPIVCNKSNVIIEGVGFGATLISPATNATGAANIVIGSNTASSQPQNIEVRDLMLSDGVGSSTASPYTGSKNALIMRCNNGRIRNVRTAHQALDGIRIEGTKVYGTATTLTSAVTTTPSQGAWETWNVASSAPFAVNGFARVGAVSDTTGDPDPEIVQIISKPSGTSIQVARGYSGSTVKTQLSGTAVTQFSTVGVYDNVVDDAYVIFAARNGVFIDSWATDCEFVAVKVDGGDDGAHKLTQNGFYNTGAGNSFLVCHAYFCVNGFYGNGAALTVQCTQDIIGGAYETNTNGIRLEWCKNSNLSTRWYGNSAQNVWLANCSIIRVTGFAFNNENLTSQHIYVDGGKQISIDNYKTSDNTESIQVIKFVNGVTRSRIIGCEISRGFDASYSKMVNLGDATYCEISGNVLEGSIWEDTGADYNQIHHNIMPPLSPAPSAGEQPTVHVVGANTTTT